MTRDTREDKGQQSPFVLEFYRGEFKPESEGHSRNSSSGSVVIHEESSHKEECDDSMEKEEAPEKWDIQKRIDEIRAGNGRAMPSDSIVVILEDAGINPSPCISVNRENKKVCKKGCCIGAMGLCLIAEWCLYIGITAV